MDVEFNARNEILTNKVGKQKVECDLNVGWLQVQIKFV